MSRSLAEGTPRHQVLRQFGGGMVGAGAAAAAPELRAMLEWLGMISVGADGTITVNWDGATPEDNPMIGLTDQLSELTDVLYSIFLGIDDTASGPLSAIQTYLNNLDGRSVTTYVDTVYSGAPAGMAPPGLATGGVVTRRLAKDGPEALTRPGHAMRAIAPTDGLYAVPGGTYVSPAGATAGAVRGRGSDEGVHFHGPVYITTTR